MRFFVESSCKDQVFIDILTVFPGQHPGARYLRMHRMFGMPNPGPYPIVLSRPEVVQPSLEGSPV